jgi:uncharacterized phiE125 gp8 family phage protein
MQRTIVTPAVLAPAALAELKQWLGITTAADDAPLAALLAAALETCEGFTGAMPLEAVCEEVLPLCHSWPETWRTTWQHLATRPVQAITAVDGISAAGDRFALASDAYEAKLDADGGGRVRVTAPGDATRVAVRFTAGLAPDWDALPDGLRHGVMRLAAHQHRQREGDGAAPLPPAAVAALWRPWRRLRLA